MGMHDKTTPLHGAAYNGCVGCATALLDEGGAFVDVANSRGFTPLHYAAQQGHAEVARILLAAGADPGARNNAGQTPLDKARDNKHEEVVGVFTSLRSG